MLIKKSLSSFALGGAVLLAPLFASQAVLALPTPNDVYVSPTGTGTDCTVSDPCGTFAQALAKANKYGTVHVANGAYDESLNITKGFVYIVADNDHGATVTTDSSNTGYGVSINGAQNVVIKGLDFVVPSENSSIGYALHAYQSKNLLLQNDSFTGTGSHAGGVDVNSSPNVTEEGVSATGFAKNGFSFTAQYNTGDQVGSGIDLTNLTSANNHWSGIAFYTESGSGNSPGHDIGGVSFNGTNTISGSGQSGIYFDGGVDFNPSVAPTYRISGPGDKAIDLGHTNFSNNFLNIVNYQHKKVLAITAQFNGVTGNNMTNTERSAEASKVFDHVVFYQQAHATSPNNGATVKKGSPNLVLHWSKVKGAVSYNYQSSNVNGNVNDSNNSLQTPVYSTQVTDNQIPAPGTPSGTWWWQVQPVFADNSVGVWSVPSSIIVK